MKTNKIIGVIEINAIKRAIDFNALVIDELKNTGRSLKKINDSLKLVGLDSSVIKKYLFQLSAGEQTKVLLAKALLTRSKTIILEFPTYHLDSKGQKNLIKLVKLMKLRYNRTIIILSHDTELIHKVADYVLIMNDDDIILEGDKYTVFSEYNILNKYHIKVPKIMYFSNLVKQKENINLGFRDDTSDLMKDIYRFTQKNS